MILFYHNNLPVRESIRPPKDKIKLSIKDDLTNYKLTNLDTRNIMFLFNIYFPSDEIFVKCTIVRIFILLKI